MNHINHSYQQQGGYLLEFGIDKFGQLIDLPRQDWDQTRNRLHKLAKKGVITFLMNQEGNPKRLDKFFHEFYKVKYRHGKQEYTVMISAVPNEKLSRKRRAFLRIEFNPSRLTEDHFIELGDIQRRIVGKSNFDDLPFISRVSMIDYAADLLGIGHKDVLILVKHARKLKIFRRHHEIRSIYIGSNTSDRRTKLYDKVNEIRAHHNKDFNPGFDALRLEIRKKPYCHFDELLTSPNYLQDVTFYKRALLPDDFDDTFMLRLCELDLQGAFRDAQHRNINYSKQLEKYLLGREFFDADALWATLPEKLAFLHILYPGFSLGNDMRDRQGFQCVRR